jgi:HEAT repeat
MIHNPSHQQLVLDTLSTNLQDPTPVIRAKAAQALGQIGNTTINQCPHRHWSNNNTKSHVRNFKKSTHL